MWGCALGPFEASALMATPPRKEERKKESPLIPKQTVFQDLLWNMSMTNLVILAAAVFDIWYGKTDRQTLPLQLPSAWAKSKCCAFLHM